MSFVLLDLPTLPKGVASLSLPVVAAYLRDSFDVTIIDLNLAERSSALRQASSADGCGLKVSAQNFEIAIGVSAELKRLNPRLRIVWGGELATLLPERCQQYADAVVSGPFEPHAEAFARDFRRGELKKFYSQMQIPAGELVRPPALELLKKGDYLGFMGMPLEFSKGCVFKCTFCMVHTMQPQTGNKSVASLHEDLAANPRAFVNVVDYNLGSYREHLLAFCEEMRVSGAHGWMGEMCLEALDDDEVLAALRDSRCRIVYVGLESITPTALQSVNKRQNKVGEYRRIIRRAQEYGIQIGAGFILGLAESTAETFRETLKELESLGIIYMKLTFLTYNPGTKVKTSMARMGRYLTEEISAYDGFHLTFLPRGVDPKTVEKGAKEIARGFYSLRSYLKRSRHLAFHPLKRLEFILFSYCYGRVYRTGWRSEDLSRALEAPLRRTPMLRLSERLLAGLRWMHFLTSDRTRHRPEKVPASRKSDRQGAA